MTGVSFSVEIDDTQARESIRALIDRMDNTAPFLDAVGAHLVNSTTERFGGNTAPDGTSWAGLAPSTIQQRIKRGLSSSQILLAGGELRGSIIYQREGDTIRIGPNSVGNQNAYAAIHQFGGAINRPAREGKLFDRINAKVRAYTINLPARPFLGLSDADEAAIGELAQDWLDFG